MGQIETRHLSSFYEFAYLAGRPQAKWIAKNTSVDKE
jgi:hypothetical protein